MQISDRKFSKLYEMHLGKLLECKRMLGLKQYTNLTYSQIINDTVKLWWSDMNSFQSYLKNNPSICLLMNEIDGSLNPYNTIKYK